MRPNVVLTSILGEPTNGDLLVKVSTDVRHTEDVSDSRSIWPRLQVVRATCVRVLSPMCTQVSLTAYRLLTSSTKQYSIRPNAQRVHVHCGAVYVFVSVICQGKLRMFVETL